MGYLSCLLFTRLKGLCKKETEFFLENSVSGQIGLLRIDSQTGSKLDFVHLNFQRLVRVLSRGMCYGNTTALGSLSHSLSTRLILRMYKAELMSHRLDARTRGQVNLNLVGFRC